MSRTNTGGFAEEAQSTFAAAVPPETPVYATLELGQGGRVVIPAAMRSAMGLKEGAAMLAKYADGVVTLESQASAIKRVQASLQTLRTEGVSMVDELIEDRRREAVREWDEAVLGPLPPDLRKYR